MKLIEKLRRRRPEPAPIEDCCLRAKAERPPSGYYLHRVRVHGEGSA